LAILSDPVLRRQKEEEKRREQTRIAEQQRQKEAEMRRARENHYNNLLEKKRKAWSEASFKDLADEFCAIPNYRDSNALAMECEMRYKELKDERIYSDATAEMARKKQYEGRKLHELRLVAREWEQISDTFRKVAEYEDASALADECMQLSQAAYAIVHKKESRKRTLKIVIASLIFAATIAAIIGAVLLWDNGFFDGVKKPASRNYPEAELTEPYEEEPTTAPTNYYKVATGTSTLHIRSGPSTDYAILGSIPNGTTVQISKTQQGWGYVTYGGVTGWSSMDYLQPEAGATATPYVTIAAITEAPTKASTTVSLFDLEPSMLFEIDPNNYIVTNVSDAFGNRYSKAILVSRGGGMFYYNIDSKYKILKLTITRCGDAGVGNHLRILSHNDWLYEFSDINNTTEPFDVIVDVSNVNNLNLWFSQGTGQADLLIINPMLYTDNSQFPNVPPNNLRR